MINTDLGIRAGRQYMVLLFNRRKLFMDISQVECYRVKQILQREKIEYYYKTVKNTSNLSRLGDVGAQARYAMSYSTKRDNASFIYYIYVKRKDYSRAMKLIKE
jgi:hypothetical protein